MIKLRMNLHSKLVSVKYLGQEPIAHSGKLNIAMTANPCNSLVQNTATKKPIVE